MAVIIETGAQVANSNSYSTRADYIAYALTLGTVIADTVAADDQLVAAAVFIGSKENSLKGDRVDRDQSMAFPRNGLVIEGFSWLSTEIPRQVLLAQMSLALDINAGEDLYNLSQSESTGLKSERVEGAVTVEYANVDSMKLSRRSSSNALLASLMKNGGLFSVSITMG
jgi:hypothetical protein